MGGFHRGPQEPGGQLSSAVNPQFRERRIEVVLDGLLADKRSLGDFSVGESAEDQEGDFLLAPAQAVGQHAQPEALVENQRVPIRDRRDTAQLLRVVGEFHRRDFDSAVTKRLPPPLISSYVAKLGFVPNEICLVLLIPVSTLYKGLCFPYC